MSYGTRWRVLMALIAMTGCGGNEQYARSSAAGYADDAREALRIRSDAARSRQWVLTLDGVKVYDTRTKALIRGIALPGWLVARILCHPDLALDRSGSALVSSNIEPKLWRIDGESFEVTVREIRLHEREQWDVGFGALAYSADGTLLASTYKGGTLWRVDMEKSSANIVLANATRTCDLAPGPGSNLERSR